MKIKILNAPIDLQFQEGEKTIRLFSEPVRAHGKPDQMAKGLATGRFICGSVEMWKINPSDHRIKEVVGLSMDYFEENDAGVHYDSAMREGFDVLPGAEPWARLLIDHNLAIAI